MINRENYEIWFLDYAEGQLSTKQVRLLMAFLEENPDLKEELEAFVIVELPKTSVSYAAKSELKQTGELPLVNLQNYDDYLIGKIEGDLSNNDQEGLDRFFENHAEKKSDLNIYQQLKLKPDYTIRYRKKRSLKKRNRRIPIYYATGIAAGIAILFILSGVFNPADNPAKQATQSVPSGESNITEHNNLRPRQQKGSLAYSGDMMPLINNSAADAAKKTVHPANIPDNIIPQPALARAKTIGTKKLEPTNLPIAALDKIDFPEPTNIAADPNRTSKQPVSRKLLEENPPSMKQKQDDWLALVEKGIEKISGSETTIQKTENNNKKRFSIQVGRFGFSKVKKK